MRTRSVSLVSTTTACAAFDFDGTIISAIVSYSVAAGGITLSLGGPIQGGKPLLSGNGTLNSDRVIADLDTSVGSGILNVQNLRIPVKRGDAWTVSAGAVCNVLLILEIP